MDLKNIKTIALKVALVAIAIALIVVSILLLFNVGGKNKSLEIEAPELIEDCWVLVDGKKATDAKIKVGKKIKLSYGSYPEADKDIRMTVSVDKKYSDIVSIKNQTVTGLSEGNATLKIAVLFPGSLGGKVSMALPVKVYSKGKKNDNQSVNQSSKPTSIFGNSIFDKIFSKNDSSDKDSSVSSKKPSSNSSKKTSSKKTSSKKPSSTSSKLTSSKFSNTTSLNSSNTNSFETVSSNSSEATSSTTTPKVEICDACGQTIINAFDHEVLECYNHYRCEPNVNEVSHDLAPCGDHQACDEGNHELRSCLSHFECDAEFSSLPCGHCSCEHSAEETCE